MKSALCSLLLAVAKLQAEEPPATVAVCLDYQGVEVKAGSKARYVAWQIFKDIGVKIVWSICEFKKRPEDVRIRFVAQAPDDLPPGILAFALPYEGKTVEIYYDRVHNGTPSFLGDVLGHVMAHEIAHLLQGVARHSESGVLKPNWSAEEKEQMSRRPLQFTSHDAELIRTGIASRASKRAAARAPSNALR
ncbi:MAG: hypothetical protein ABI972_03870 [Acidobacteriota bacterium]